MCDSTQGSFCPSPMGIHQCMRIQWSILQKLPHTYTYYIHILHTHTTYRISDHIVSFWTTFRRDKKNYSWAIIWHLYFKNSEMKIIRVMARSIGQNHLNSICHSDILTWLTWLRGVFSCSRSASSTWSRNDMMFLKKQNTKTKKKSKKIWLKLLITENILLKFFSKKMSHFVEILMFCLGESFFATRKKKNIYKKMSWPTDPTWKVRPPIK